jgi:hypothetical protein
MIRYARRFLTHQQYVVSGKSKIMKPGFRLARQKHDARAVCTPESCPVRMAGESNVIDIVHCGAPEPRIGKYEAAWFYHVYLNPQTGGQAKHSADIAWDFGLEKRYSHGTSLTRMRALQQPCQIRRLHLGATLLSGPPTAPFQGGAGAATADQNTDRRGLLKRTKNEDGFGTWQQLKSLYQPKRATVSVVAILSILRR